MSGPHATIGHVRSALARGLDTQQVSEYLRRTTSWAHPVELLEQAIAHHDPEYIDETPLIETRVPLDVAAGLERVDRAVPSGRCV